MNNQSWKMFAGLSVMMTLVVSHAFSAEPRLWTTKEGQTGKGDFVEITGTGDLTLRNVQGREFKVPVIKLCTNDLAFLAKDNRLGVCRAWKMKAGRTVQAHFVAQQPGGVLVVTPEGHAGVVSPDKLSNDDVTWLDLEAPIPVESRIAGTWRGFMAMGGTTYHTIVNISPNGSQWRGSATLWAQVSSNQTSMASGKDAQRQQSAFQGKSTFSVTVTNGVMTWSKYMTSISMRGKGQSAQWALGRFSGMVTNPGVWVADGTCTAGTGTCWLAKESLFRHHAPLTLQKGQTLRMTCSDPRLHYTLYIPKSYDPAIPAPLLVNDSPGRNASPLSPKMAEELGWIMVGLTESGNDAKTDLEWLGNNAAVIFDVTRRFNIDPRRFYFSGFSGGSRRSSYRAIEFPDNCAGLVCIGAGYAYDEHGVYLVPAKTVPIFYIVGASDMNHDEVTKRMMEPDYKRGRAYKLVIHPGGHSWGRGEDHEAALRWLDEQWKSAHPRERISRASL